MDEEDEDLLDVFADENDPLLSNDVVDSYPKPDEECKADKSEEKADIKPEPADEATALAELPYYTPIEKDKDVGIEDKIGTDNNLAPTLCARSEVMTEPLSGEQKIDSSLNDIISDNKRREDRKRRLDALLDETYDVKGHKQRYRTKNGVQLCLHPRKDIAKMSEQEAGNELARCLDEPKKILMEDTINILGLDKALELLAETAEIQENGGMTTQDGKLKRPGGVFISLLKQSITEEQIKSIFRRDRQLDNQSKKKRKRMKVKQDKAKVAQMKKRMDKDLEKMEEKRWNEVKQELPDVKLEKRFGIVDKDDDVDLMEVDTVSSPACDEMTSEMANGDDQDGSNHYNQADDFHDNKVDGYHDNEVDANHDNEILNGTIYGAI